MSNANAGWISRQNNPGGIRTCRLVQLRVNLHVLPHARLFCACRAIKSFKLRDLQKMLLLVQCTLSLEVLLSALLLKGLRHQISCFAWES